MRFLRVLLIGVVGALILPATEAHTTGKYSRPETSRARVVQEGRASWYSRECNGGTHTASGETLNDWAMTAAHKTLAMGTKVRVTNLRNGRSVVLRINDRGPYIKGRIIDVTKGAAHKLGFIKAGVVPVKVEVL